MFLYLVRHAEPKQKEEDTKRPLSTKGWTDIRKIAAYCSEQFNISTKRIIHSGKLRAQQTAESLSERLRPPLGIEEVADLNPLDDPKLWGKRLYDMSEDAMIVGHLPHLGKLTSYLLTGDENKETVLFHAGTIVCLKRDESNVWSIEWSLNPDDV
jgi:phosphohistidine phosphatase